MVVGGGGEGKAAGVDKASPGRGYQVGGDGGDGEMENKVFFKRVTILPEIAETV